MAKDNDQYFAFAAGFKHGKNAVVWTEELQQEMEQAYHKYSGSYAPVFFEEPVLDM